MSAAIRPEHIPDEFKAIPHWINFALEPQPDGKKDKKKPYIPGTKTKARINDRRTFHTYEEALADYKRTGRLPGFVITPEMGLTLVDVDGRIDYDLIALLNSYSERSINGGLHILVWGRPPAGFAAPPGMEIYPSSSNGNRGVIITAELIDGRGTIEERSAELATLCPPKPAPVTTRATAGRTLEDDAVLANARRMAGFPPLFDDGDLLAYDGDHSRADAGLLNYLISAGATDPEQLDHLHRASALARDKWDQRRGSTTYGERTITFALNGHVRPFDGWSTPPIESPQRAKNGATAQKPQDAVLLADAPDPTPCQLRVAELERENAALRAQLAAERERTQAAETKLAKLSAVQSRTSGIIRNKQLGQERITAAAISYEFANREAAGDPGEDGLYAIPLARIAEAAGVSVDAAGKHVTKLVETGVIRKVVRFVPETVDPTTGEIKPAHKRQFIGPAAGNVIDFVTAVANLAPEKPKQQWGGARRGCPDHPEAGTVKKWTIHCAVCDRQLDQGQDDPQPGVRPQDAVLVPREESAATREPIPAVATTLRGRNRPSYHNDDLAATGTEGPPAPRYDDAGTSVAAAWQRGQALPGFDPPPLDHLTDVAYGARK